MLSYVRHASAAAAFQKDQHVLSGTEPAFLVMSHLWDETRLNLYLPELNQHALLTWECNGQADHVSHESLVPSSVLSSNSVTCMCATMRKHCPFTSGSVVANDIRMRRMDCHR